MLKDDFLTSLSQNCIKRQEYWDKDNQLDYMFFCLEFIGEAGELANLIKKLKREQLGLNGSRTNNKEIMNEVADCLITLVNLTNSLGIDLKSATTNKFNETSKKMNIPVLILNK